MSPGKSTHFKTNNWKETLERKKIEEKAPLNGPKFAWIALHVVQFAHSTKHEEKFYNNLKTFVREIRGN